MQQNPQGWLTWDAAWLESQNFPEFHAEEQLSVKFSLCRAGWAGWTLCSVQERWCWLRQVACSAENHQHNTLSTGYPGECQHIGTLCQHLPAGTSPPATSPEMLLPFLPVPCDSILGSLKGESLQGFWERKMRKHTAQRNTTKIRANKNNSFTFIALKNPLLSFPRMAWYPSWSQKSCLMETMTSSAVSMSQRR